MSPAEVNKEWNLLKQQFDQLVHELRQMRTTRVGTVSPRRLANEPARLGTFGQTTLRI
jgi:hypothetical protein